MTDRVGEQFGKYHLEQLLGHGGFADVYLGEHSYLKSQAAIKILHARVDSNDAAAFLSEARMVAGLQHPHIVRVLDFDVTPQGDPFFAMEYAPNGSLRRRYPRGTRLPLDMIVSYTKQVASALQYAHNQKLIHCDIKPENMLLSNTNQILLSDFGIAVIAHTSRSHNMQEITGTASYMAPEQLQGKASPASDQYALGIVVYEWLTGNAPFQGTLTEVVTQHMLVPPRPLREILPTLSADIEHVVSMALAKDPGQRFARVEAFANALEQASRSSTQTSFDSATFIVPATLPPDAATFIVPDAMQPATFATVPAPVASNPNTGPTIITPPGPHNASNTPPYNPMLMAQVVPPPEVPGHTVKVDEPQEAKKQQPTVSRRGLLIGVVGVAALATGGTLFALAEKSNLFPTPPTVVATHTLTGVPTTAPSQSPTQQLTQQPTSAPTTAPTQPPPTTSPTIQTYATYNGPSNMFTVAWSPVSSSIASAGQGSSLEVWNALSSTNLFAPINTGASTIYSVAWSPDGRYIVSGQDNGTIQIWDAATGTNVTSWQGHSSRVNSVAWSPNGIYIASGSADKTAKVWDANTYSVITNYTGHAHFIDSVAWSSDSSTIVSGSGDATAQVWTATTGNLINTYRGHTAEVVSVVWMPRGGTRIASASVDKTVQVWDASTGTTYINYTQHASTVNTVAWSPDTSRIASGGLDDRVRVWSAASGNTLLIYSAHTDQIQSVAWSPDSTKVASASNDGTVKVWQAT